jgi:biotin transport system substrate-specific component
MQSFKKIEFVFIALFAALIAVSGFISIPLSFGVPIVLQNMMILLAGLLLGPVRGFLAVLLFLAAGAIGLPVFAGGTSGFARFFGVSGGYLYGYLIIPVVAGLIYKHNNKISLAIACFVGLLSNYPIGITQMAYLLDKSWLDAAYANLAFLPTSLIKMGLAFFITISLQKTVDLFLAKN